MKFDILINDQAGFKPYNDESLENDVLGGTESSTVRLAEGFASKGHTVAVLQRHDFLPHTSKCGVKYLPLRWMRNITATNVIHLRGIKYLPHYHEKSKQFVWLHDAGQPFLKDWDALLAQCPATLIAVSDWHVSNLKENGLQWPVQRIYSPLDEECYKLYKSYNPNLNQLVWLSSPHKGLQEAIEVFKKLRQHSSNLSLAVFNPGYFAGDKYDCESVHYITGASRAELRSVTKNSLALFYPTQFEETFGLVAAESEALGTPVATYKVAALGESVRDSGWMQNEEILIHTILQWQARPPRVLGQERFKFEEVYKDWNKILT